MKDNWNDIWKNGWFGHKPQIDGLKLGMDMIPYIVSQMMDRDLPFKLDWISNKVWTLKIELG
jgi:hypothetical protein